MIGVGLVAAGWWLFSWNEKESSSVDNNDKGARTVEQADTASSGVQQVPRMEQSFELSVGERDVSDSVSSDSFEEDISAENTKSEDATTFEELAGGQRYMVPSAARETEARRAISETVFGEQGPVECEDICDCQPGEGCDSGAGICVPGLFAGRCCDWEGNCPPGAPCTVRDGTQSYCN